MAKLLATVRERELMNIRLYDDDATQLLDWLPEGSIDHIDLLYPDPWPKKKHWKRRFVSAVNLDRFARVLKPGGRIQVADVTIQRPVVEEGKRNIDLWTG